MALRLSGQTSIFGVVFFVFEPLLGIERQKKLKKFTTLTRKPRSHVRILIYRTWPIHKARNENGMEILSSKLKRFLCFVNNSSLVYRSSRVQVLTDACDVFLYSLVSLNNYLALILISYSM